MLKLRPSLLIAAWATGAVAIAVPLVLAGFSPEVLTWALAAYSVTLALGLGPFVYTTAAEARAADPRPPILYLRSFGDDNALHNGIWARYLLGILAARPGDVGDHSFEVNIVRILKRYGPVIAVGRPREWLPTRGAARLYVDDDRWQEVVGALIAESGLVVVVAGDTPGLYWEIRQVAGLGALDRLVLVFPPLESGERRRRWGPIRETIRDAGLPDVPPELPDRAMFGVFDGPEGFRFVEHRPGRFLTRELVPRSDFRDEMFYESLLPSVIQAKGLSLPPSRPEDRRATRQGWVFALLAVGLPTILLYAWPRLYRPRAVVVDEPGRRQAWVIRNAGWAPLELSVAARSGRRIANLADDRVLRIEPGAEVALVLERDPAAGTDAAAGYVHLRTNDPDGPLLMLPKD